MRLTFVFELVYIFKRAIHLVNKQNAISYTMESFWEFFIPLRATCSLHMLTAFQHKAICNALFMSDIKYGCFLRVFTTKINEGQM